MQVLADAMATLADAIGKAVSKALKQLLSEKHLYQYVEVETSFIPGTSETVLKNMVPSSGRVLLGGAHLTGPRPVPPTKSDAEHYCRNQMAAIWFPDGASSGSLQYQSLNQPIGFALPTINTFCDTCDSRWPFNPVLESSFLVPGAGQDECYYLGYQCQQCKGQPIRFLVRREGLKLRLAGRYPIEVLPTPKVLPKAAFIYYSNAVIAHHAGQTLAGLFLLRVFIEQFWRTIPAVAELVLKQPKATGDEQGNAYQETLPPDFKSRFPSLTEIYDKLSAAIHSADENAALFEDSCSKIMKHFEARRLFEI